MRNSRHTKTVLPYTETAATLFWASLASGQIAVRKIDRRKGLAERPDDRVVDLAARSNAFTPPTSRHPIPAPLATAAAYVPLRVK